MTLRDYAQSLIAAGFGDLRPYRCFLRAFGLCFLETQHEGVLWASCPFSTLASASACKLRQVALKLRALYRFVKAGARRYLEDQGHLVGTSRWWITCVTTCHNMAGGGYRNL